MYDTTYVDRYGVNFAFSMRKRLSCNSVTNIEYCYRCLTREKSVTIYTSAIPNAGYGVFATTDLAVGWKIRFVNENVLTTDELRSKFKNMLQCYIVGLGKKKVMDCSNFRCCAAFVNGSSGEIKSNSKLVHYQGATYIKTTKPISCGDEIYVTYGKSYHITI